MDQFIESDSEHDSQSMDGISKRKTPSPDSIAPVVPNSPMDTSFKHPRMYSFEPKLPPLRQNEAELIIDLAEFVNDIEESDLDASGYGRVERESALVTLVGLTFRLVSFLSRKLDDKGAPVYDLGLYIRVEPPSSESDTWSYRSVSMMVMLVHAKNAYGEESKVCRDTCQFSSHDPCRGWASMVSFSSPKELADQGYTYRNGLLLTRGQVFFEGSPLTTPRDYTVPYRGLENMGATCYLAALLQSLFHIGSFRQLVYSSPSADDSDILSALQCVFSDLEESSSESAGVSAEPLTHAFGWDVTDVGVQQDAQELNRILIDRIESLHKDQVTHLFSGELENYIECLDVEYTSRRVEKFYDLQMNLITHNPVTGQAEPITSLHEAIDKYLSPEILDGPNMYDAESFGKQRARKGVRFLSLPPVLSFQLMRFQFDYETFDMKKLNSKFSFPERLIMSGLEYVLHSVLVHSGNVNAGHYYAYVRPDGRTDWFKFDDTEVRLVDSFTAIQNNFGGSHPKDNLVDYLHESSATADDQANRREKVYSAYMLTYIRADMLSEVLRESRFANLPDSVRSAILERKTTLKEKLSSSDAAKRRSSRRKRRDSSSDDSATGGAGNEEQIVPLRVINIDDVSKRRIFDSLLTSADTLKTSWLMDFVNVSNSPYTITDSVAYVPGNELIGTALKNLVGNMGQVFFMISDPENRVRFFELSENEATSATLKDLSKHVAPAPVVLAVSSNSQMTSGDSFFVVEFDPSAQTFQFRGLVHASGKGDDLVRNLKLTICDQSWGSGVCAFYAHTKNFDLVPIDSVANLLESGMFIVIQTRIACEPGEQDATEYMKTLSNTFEIDLYVHDALRDKWLLGEVPAIAHALVPNGKAEWNRPIDHFKKQVDVRHDIASLGDLIPGYSRETANLLVFADDPLLDEVKAGEDLNQEGWKIVDVVGRRGLQFHCAVIPKARQVVTDERWLMPKALCIRFFSDKVVEEGCWILHAQANMTVCDLIKNAKECFGLHVRCRLLQIDVYDCEIVSEHAEDDQSLVSTLMAWGARNILATSLRLEPVPERGSNTESVRCYHYDRSTRRRFGHPFVLEVPHDVSGEKREATLRDLISHKLDVPSQVVRGWRLTEAEKDKVAVLEILHSSNPWTTKGTPRERGLVIKA